MTLAEQLRNEGLNKPDFTKDELMKCITERIRKNGEAGFTVGKHVGTDLEDHTIGMCNPYNREFLVKWVSEEGFKWNSTFNCYGVERIHISL